MTGDLPEITPAWDGVIRFRRPSGPQPGAQAAADTAELDRLRRDAAAVAQLWARVPEHFRAEWTYRAGVPELHTLLDRLTATPAPGGP